MGYRTSIFYGWFFLLGLGLAGCSPPNHYLIHPQEVPPTVITWADDVKRDQLLIHLEWAKPVGCGPFPTILVHPEGGKTAMEMKGVIWDLALNGYLAVAIDYKRMLNGEYQRNTFAWRSDADVVAALDIVSDYSFVDQKRIATLGFSQGGIFSLMIAAHAPDRVRAVVAYYPVTDFEYWFDKYRPHPIRRFVYRMIRRHFYRESGAKTDSEFREILRRASPMPHAHSIRAPVLLIHGDSDKAASMEESQRLADRLKALNKEVRFIVVPKGVHIFNFRQPEKATFAWKETLDWLKRYLQVKP